MEDTRLKYIIKSAIGIMLFAGLPWILMTTRFTVGRATYWQAFAANLLYLPILGIAGAIWGALTWKENIINIAQRRQEQGLCKQCGYDIRNSGVDTCPECGTPDVSS